MSNPRTLFLLFILSSSFTAFAQVYESTDAEGNKSFSDTPSSGSQEIVIPETNTGDAVKVPEPKPEPTPKPEVVEQPATPPEAVEGDYNNGSGNYYRHRRHRRYGHGR